MKINTFQLIATLIAICFLSFGMISSSNAAEIIEFPSDTEDTSYGGYTYHMAYLKTDVPYTAVDWYIGDWQWQESDMGDGVTTTAYFCPYDKIPGVIKGKKYTITAKAWFEGSHDIKSYTVRMFEPIWLYGTGPNTGARGTVEISRFYYDGSQIIMDAYAFAYNPKNNPKAKKLDYYPLSVLPWFRTDKYDAPNGQVDEEKHHRDTKSIDIIQLGETSPTYNPGPYTDPEPWRGGGKLFDRDVGIIEEGKPLYYNAHAHMQVFDGFKPADNWEVDTEHQTGTTAVTFTSDDGP